MRHLLFLSILLSLVTFNGTKAQQISNDLSHIFSFKPQFFQIKDAFNYGLVFNGLNLFTEYELNYQKGENLLSISPELAFGASYNPHSGLGLSWHFIPIDLYYGFKLKKVSTKSVLLGPYFATNYNWQMYPELQSGHMLWFTSFELGSKLMITLPLIKREFLVSFSTSLAGFVSRPEPATEIHFYSLKMSDFVNNAHHDLKFGFSERFNHTNLEIELIRKEKKKMSLAYEFEYFGNYLGPKVSFVSHSINMKWVMRGKKNSI